MSPEVLVKCTVLMLLSCGSCRGVRPVSPPPGAVAQQACCAMLMVLCSMQNDTDRCGLCAAFRAAPRDAHERRPPGFGVCAHLPTYQFVSPHKGCHIEPPRFRPRVQRKVGT